MYVHIRNDKIIDISPETRIPRSYNRFIGLMEQLFLTGGVPPENPLMKIQNMTLPEKIEEINPDKTITLSEKGKEIDSDEIFQNLGLEEDICVIIGGFPHGDFLSDVESLSDEIIKIYPESLDAVSAITHMIQFYEEEYNII